jgi:hypothetical protein
MNTYVSNGLKILAGTLISALVGYFLTGPLIFDVASQFFHFIMAGFIISLMWLEIPGRLVKAGVVLVLFLLYKGILAPSFTDLFTRDLIYFLIFFLLSLFPPGMLGKLKFNRPVSRFIFGGLIVAAGYMLAALLIMLFYPGFYLNIWSLIKVNLLYGLTIGMAVELGFELVNAIITVIHGRSTD